MMEANANANANAHIHIHNNWKSQRQKNNNKTLSEKAEKNIINNITLEMKVKMKL